MLRQRPLLQILQHRPSYFPVPPRAAPTASVQVRIYDVLALNSKRRTLATDGLNANQTRLLNKVRLQKGARTPIQLHCQISSFHSTCLKTSQADPQKTPSSDVSVRKRRRLLPSISERENITNVPNILTVTRLVAAPVIGYFILHDCNAWALGLLAYASLTDLVDGYIARRWNLQTVIGTVLDPLADKLLMTILTVCLAVKGALPIWIAGLILGKDAGLGIAAIYYRWISLPPPKTFWRYWDFSLPSAEVKPTTISKYNTALQFLLLMAATAEPLVAMDISTAMAGLEYTVGTTTVWSGLSYVYNKDAVRILPREEEPPQNENQEDKKPM
ncbi:hypothetical protein TWF225_010640 [Orbilia oligospora]|uniref:Uncharacterized protein n=1 Tax=Orbilia oligospora TaxID=2813651 RepID=A0A7C8KE75_ORBOL|nr:hypothetical protein TWF751_000747 [Orbilia oligospora]KAF3171170.1 hypothetical protein TWF225_010640 [Orbilia oligospora]KAF3237335.1 hypothetical protein TWF128_000945 [Orbilia oligospora]KAF3243804.1 hypothetical protein TWF217_011143 [Orbilia oligospora]KAF3293477.1 hypothetical protein TWF132_004788 [Orbilia oligospora]